jgi:L-lactate dehydrogenase complex protein LldG
MAASEERMAQDGGRERILGRIRSALRVEAPKHLAIDGADGSAAIFAPIDDVLGRFRQECQANRTEFVLTSDLGASAAAVGDLLAEMPAGEIFAQDAPMLRRMEPMFGGRAIRWSSEGGAGEASLATITCAEALVARTGSVFVSSGCGGRGASIVAPVHVVVATMDQLVAGLDEAFARLRASGAVERNSMLCLVTGSSRTADIEKIIVMGAHGPRRVVVILAGRSG